MRGQIRVKGAAITYEVEGEGAPLVLIAGLGAGRWIWAPQVEALAARFRVVTFDNRGIGDSRRDSGPLSIGSMAGDAVAVLDALGVARAHVAGMSMGGFIAQTVAAQWPERVDRLVLCCTAGRGFGQVWPAPGFFRMLLRFRPGQLPPLRLAAFFGEGYRCEHGDQVAFWAKLASEHMPSYRLVIEQLLASARFNVKGNLGAIHCPTLVIHGTADQVIPVSNGRALAAKIPGARLVLVDGAGHAVTIEQAGLVNREIERFLGPRAAE